MTHRPLVLFGLLICLTLTACDKPEVKREKYIERGDALFEKKDYDRARLEYKNALRLAPADSEIAYRLALTDEAQGKISEAIKGFLSAEQQNPHQAGALSKLAQYFLTAGEIEQAEKRIAILLADAPDAPQALALDGALALRKGDKDRAQSQAQAALTHEKGHVLASAVLAGTASSRGDIPQALAAIQNGLEVHPQDLSLLLLHVALRAKAGELEAMDAAYRTIFAAYPDVLSFRFDLAESWLKAGHKDKAETALREALSVAPQSREAKLRLFRFLAEQKGFAAAEKEALQLKAARPEDPDPALWLAELYVVSGEEVKAVILLKELAERAENETVSLRAQTALAQLYLSDGQKESAQKLIAFVLKNEPSNSDALFLRARMAFETGELERAVGDLRLAAQNAKAAPRALSLLAETLLKQGRLDLATDSLVQLLSQDPTNKAARVRLAQFYGLAGQTERALQTVKLATKMDPAYPIAWEAAARLALEAGDEALFDQALEKLSGLDGQKPTSQFLRAEKLAKTGDKKQAASLYQGLITGAAQTPLALHAATALVRLEPSREGLGNSARVLEPVAFVNAGMATLYGQALAASGQTETAAQAFDRAMALDPSASAPAIERAKLFIAAGDGEKAIALLEQAAQKNPSDTRAAFLLADLFSAQDKMDKAATVYEALLQKDPSSDLAANNLAQILADTRMGDARAMERARTLAERFIASPHPYFLDTLGWVYLRAGQNEQALPVLQRAMGMMDNPPPQMRYHYGLMLLKNGQTEAARSELTLATDGKVAPYPGLEEARRWLATLPPATKTTSP